MADLIPYLAQLIAQDNAVLFVGANLREGPGQRSAVQQIADALAARIQYRRPDRSLPAVARDFQVLRGRDALILALREELERLSSQPGPIHQLIADAVLPTTKLITTRIDRLLEQALEQFQKPYVLIVRDTDVSFFDESKITLIKIQGDIYQPDSLVITEDDIDAFISKLPTISDLVRAFFATKTLIFLGYELESEHFKRFFRQVTRNLASFRRRAYAIVAEPVDEVEARYWEGQNVEIRVQDPIAFLESLAQAVKAAVRQPQPVANPLSSLIQPPLPSRPYKALDSFTSADAAIFTGRKEESLRLVNRILAHRLTVLYGESGSGKTSLLQAGVGPRLAQQQALLATCTPVPGRSLQASMQASLAEAGRQLGLPQPGEDTLVGMIREWQRGLEGPIVLAIDQFEQFFLAYSPEERREAIAFLRELWNDRSLDLRLVLVIREDFLGRLQVFEEQLPGLLDVRFRLERLGREAARTAIEEPARLFDVSWEPALVERLLDDLYNQAEGGVAPPQLQIVCDRLYQEAIEESGEGPDRGEVRITLALFQRLGGTEAILGDYLERVVERFPPERQPMVRTLLGALVSSGGIKQRLTLEDLARVAELEPAEAAPLLDELTRQRLVRRYETTVEDRPRLEYELAHDYLVPRIARWLGDEFWAAQKARELIRQALPDWQERERLLAPGDLRLIAAQRHQIRFAPAELEMLYATAVAYDSHPEDWEENLTPEARRRVLLRLVQHPEASARRQAVLALIPFTDRDVSLALVEAAVGDQEAAVREAAAQAIARRCSDEASVDEIALEHLVAAAQDPSTHAPAWRALAMVRDLAPASQAWVPAKLRRSLLRQVWAARWQRHWYRILTTTLRGAQGGFLGLGLGIGLFLGLNGLYAEGVDRVRLSTMISAMSMGIPLAGVLGGLVAGSGAFVGVVMRALADREKPWRLWAVVTAVSMLIMGLGFVLLGQIFSGTPQPVRSLAAGMLIGLGLTGLAAMPWRWASPLRLGLAALAGIIAFVAAWGFGLLFNRSFWWLLIMGGIGGIGFAWGLGPVSLGEDRARRS